MPVRGANGSAKACKLSARNADPVFALCTLYLVRFYRETSEHECTHTHYREGASGAGGMVVSGLERIRVPGAEAEGIPRSYLPGGVLRHD